MSTNVGTVDRAVRIIVGIVLLSIVFTGPKTMLGLIGIIPLFTGLVRWCPLYDLLGIQSNKNERQ